MPESPSYASGNPDPLIPQPQELLSHEGLNYLLVALTYTTAKRMGPEFMGEVLAMAERLRGEREVAIAFNRDV